MTEIHVCVMPLVGHILNKPLTHTTLHPIQRVHLLIIFIEGAFPVSAEVCLIFVNM